MEDAVNPMRRFYLLTKKRYVGVREDCSVEGVLSLPWG
jgi:hypothetical protein